MSSSVDSKSITKSITDKALELAADISPHQPDINQNASAAKKMAENETHIHAQPNEKPNPTVLAQQSQAQAQAPSFFNWGKSQEYQADHPQDYTKNSTIESVKDSAQSAFESAKDTAKSTIESAKDTAKSAADAMPQQSHAPSFFNWGKSQEYQADHPEDYAKGTNIESIKDSAMSSLESAKDSAKSTYESVKDSANSALESAKDTAKSAADAMPQQSHAPSFFNWGKSQEYQADHPEDYAKHPTLDSIKESAMSSLESAKDTAKSTYESAKDSANSNIEYAKDSAKSALESAKDTAKSAADAMPQQSQAPSFFNWGKSQEYQADHPEDYTKSTTLESIKDSAMSSLESAKDSAKSTYESAKDSAKSNIESAKDASRDAINQVSEEIPSQDRAPSFFNWGKSQEYQADHPQEYIRDNVPQDTPQTITEKIGGALKSVMDSTIDAMHLPRHDRPTQIPNQFGDNESH